MGYYEAFSDAFGLNVNTFSVSDSEASYPPGEGPIRFDVAAKYEIPLSVLSLIVYFITICCATLAIQGLAFRLTNPTKSDAAREPSGATSRNDASKLSLAEHARRLSVYACALFAQGLCNTGLLSLFAVMLDGMWAVDGRTFPMTAAAAVAYLAACPLLALSVMGAARHLRWWRARRAATTVRDERARELDSKKGEMEKEPQCCINDKPKRSWADQAKNALLGLVSGVVISLSFVLGSAFGSELWPYVGQRWLEPLFQYT